MRSIQHTASINRRLSWAGRPLLPSPPGKCGLNRSQTSSVISWRRCATVIPPPSTLSPFPAIYHPTAILTTHPSPFVWSGRDVLCVSVIAQGSTTQLTSAAFSVPS